MPAPPRLRVLYLAVWYPFPPTSGSEIRSARLAQALARRHDLALIGYGRPALPAVSLEAPPPGIAPWSALESSAFTRGAWRSALGWISPKPRHHFAADRSEMRQQALAWSRQRPFDVVVASTTALAEIALELPARARVLEEHNFMGRMLADRLAASRGLLPRLRARLALAKDLAWERRLMPRFDLVTMVSELDRRAVLEAGCRPARLAVVPNGVDLSADEVSSLRSMPSSPAHPTDLVYAGSLTYGANLEAMRWFLDRVWPALRARRPELKLRITGSTAGVDLAAWSDTPGVELTGHVETVADWIRSARICIVPLQSGGGTRLKVLEAMALGRPVVATRKAVEGLDLEAGRHFALADEPAAFAAAVESLLDDEARAARLAAAARDAVADGYDWRRIGSRFVDLVEDAWMDR